MSTKKRVRRITWNTLPERVKKVREKILNAGNTIGSVEFIKRTDDTKRLMSFRLHVVNPSFASSPVSGSKKRDKYYNIENMQLTVLDVNKNIRDASGTIIGRGAYRTIPLENVLKISVRGVVYEVDYRKRREIAEVDKRLKSLDDRFKALFPL